MNFNPSDVGERGSLFGFPYAPDEADLIIIPVPWDVTVSYSEGTSQAPELIRLESSQLDFNIPGIQEPYSYPVCLLEADQMLTKESMMYREDAAGLIEKLETGGNLNEGDLKEYVEVNRACKRMVDRVHERATSWLEKGKIVATLGGDHSTPLGLMQALAQRHDDFGILQIDAHMDLREAYEGFEYSHASIMTNAMIDANISKLVQVGIRDYCEEEKSFAERDHRVTTYFDEVVQKRKWRGEGWPSIVDGMIQDLPSNVYVSFDLDGLYPSLCPNTGTPVPGGLSFYEAVYLIEAVVKSGRKIVGFDLSECGNDAWDANVASRVLYRISTAVGVSRGKLSFG